MKKTNTKFKETEIGFIPEEWKILAVKDVAVINDKNVSKNNGIDFIQYLDIASVEQGVITSLQELNIENAPSRAKRILNDNDIVISTVRPNLKHYAFIKNVQADWIASTGFAVVTPKRINQKFLYFALIRDEVTEYLSGIAASQTSTYPAINPDVIEDLLIAVPSENEQQKIAETLSSLDDKIEINRKINDNLEKIASALFKRWFVDFEFPDKDGKPYKSNGGKMIDSGFGEIPDEWEIGSVSDLISIDSGFSFSSSIFNEDGQYGLVTIKNVQDGSFLRQCSNYIKHLPDKMPDYCKLKNSDILLSLTGNVGRVCVVNGKNFLLNQRVAALNPYKEFNRAFTYFLFRQKDFQDTLINISRGTAQQNLSPIETKNLEIVIAKEEILKSFGKISNGIFLNLLNNLEEMENLISIRDSLLPKLMNGKIRIKT